MSSQSRGKGEGEGSHVGGVTWGGGGGAYLCKDCMFMQLKVANLMNDCGILDGLRRNSVYKMI